MSFGQGGPQSGPGGEHGPAGPPSWSPPGGYPGPQQPDPYAGPQGAPPSGPAPDWAALAEASEARARRRRWLLIGGGALATAAVGSVVAFAVISANSGETSANKPSGQLPPSATLPSNTDSPAPSFAETEPPPPPDPKEFISSAEKDKAPLSADTLFPSGNHTKNDGTVYQRGATDTTDKCADATQGDLGTVLTKNDCEQVFRTSYQKDGIAVTVGIAVFDSEKQALQAKKQADGGNLRSLSGASVPAFCETSLCRKTTNSYGRYAYFTITGFTNGKDVTTSDKPVFTAGDDLALFAFQQIRARGEAQASAAVRSPATA
ncbi:hypothetical protein [Streptomyces apocyni]|uniref:hypothetical protein n=1 Tax=Streptomyces apocyni TaxID=2654677 RepID=UPI0012EA575E|nr:hypothetical protein [Streptomyces apocyni]